MTIGINSIFGRPGIGSTQTAQRRNVFVSTADAYLPGGKTIKGDKARDPGNSAYSTRALRPGLVLGKITSGGYYANSIFGLSNGALTSTGTTLTVSAAAAAEIVRRIGATGTFKLTGPPTAAGVVRTVTVTYSAVDTTTGAITITALGVDEVQTLAVDTILSGGSIAFEVVDSSGLQHEIKVAYNTSWTQTVADIQTALIAKLGTAAVACAVTNTHDMTVTFSGTGYTGLPQTLLKVDISASTGPTKADVTRTTAGVDGRFVTASLVQPTDGSETPLAFIDDGYGVVIPDDDSDAELPRLPISGVVDASQLIDYPADASLKTWLKTYLSTAMGGKFVFDDSY